MTICQLCLIFSKSERVSDGNRSCPIVKRAVDEEDESCDKFEPTSYHWCAEWGGWVRLEVCQHRQMKDICMCSVGIAAQAIPKPQPKKTIVIRQKPKKQIVVRRK